MTGDYETFVVIASFSEITYFIGQYDVLHEV